MKLKLSHSPGIAGGLFVPKGTKKHLPNGRRLTIGFDVFHDTGGVFGITVALPAHFLLHDLGINPGVFDRITAVIFSGPHDVVVAEIISLNGEEQIVGVVGRGAFGFLQ